MVDFDTRTRLLIGRAGVARLQAAHVLLFGVGGVGGLGSGVWSVPELEQQASVISRPIATIKRVLIMVRVFVGFVPFSNIG